MVTKTRPLLELQCLGDVGCGPCPCLSIRAAHLGPGVNISHREAGAGEMLRCQGSLPPAVRDVAGIRHCAVLVEDTDCHRPGALGSQEVPTRAPGWWQSHPHPSEEPRGHVPHLRESKGTVEICHQGGPEHRAAVHTKPAQQRGQPYRLPGQESHRLSLLCPIARPFTPLRALCNSSHPQPCSQLGDVCFPLFCICPFNCPLLQLWTWRDVSARKAWARTRAWAWAPNLVASWAPAWPGAALTCALLQWLCQALPANRSSLGCSERPRPSLCTQGGNSAGSVALCPITLFPPCMHAGLWAGREHGARDHVEVFQGGPKFSLTITPGNLGGCSFSPPFSQEGTHRWGTLHEQG